MPDLLLHVSRGVRWDSDHVLIQGDDLQNIMHEMHRGGLFGKVAIGLDYFDATINRVAAWSIGLRACSKAILTALLTPDHLLEQAEQQGISPPAWPSPTNSRTCPTTRCGICSV